MFFIACGCHFRLNVRQIAANLFAATFWVTCRACVLVKMLMWGISPFGSPLIQCNTAQRAVYWLTHTCINGIFSCYVCSQSVVLMLFLLSSHTPTHREMTELIWTPSGLRSVLQCSCYNMRLICVDNYRLTKLQDDVLFSFQDLLMRVLQSLASCCMLHACMVPVSRGKCVRDVIWLVGISRGLMNMY